MASTRLNNTTKEEKTFFGSNPVLRNAKKSVYQDSGTESASYKGIALKCLIRKAYGFFSITLSPSISPKL